VHESTRDIHRRIRDGDPGAHIMERLQKNGLRQTRQRKVILDVFLDMNGHPTPEEIHAEALRRGHSLGLATIYRMLKVLVETGLVRKLEFGDGHGRYEPQSGREHHLHLICTRCGKTLEASAGAAHRLFEKLAADHAFVLHGHTTYLYGLCAGCVAAPPAAGAQRKGYSND